MSADWARRSQRLARRESHARAKNADREMAGIRSLEKSVGASIACAAYSTSATLRGAIDGKKGTADAPMDEWDTFCGTSHSTPFLLQLLQLALLSALQRQRAREADAQRRNVEGGAGDCDGWGFGCASYALSVVVDLAEDELEGGRSLREHVARHHGIASERPGGSNPDCAAPAQALASLRFLVLVLPADLITPRTSTSTSNYLKFHLPEFDFTDKLDLRLSDLYLKVLLAPTKFGLRFAHPLSYPHRQGCAFSVPARRPFRSTWLEMSMDTLLV
ncbi:hypothetical protein B0H17DRAFT_1216710 [Mycena rosella]|uniref:Uncharacterized protein n=1 Tax=Mycena rosella TaxID=1033263 RepID=A0AAD7C612_MYCRO|nr:hypothetical protein B0H17DRAFT_1216710 [Mycena rosella]